MIKQLRIAGLFLIVAAAAAPHASAIELLPNQGFVASHEGPFLNQEYLNENGGRPVPAQPQDNGPSRPPGADAVSAAFVQIVTVQRMLSALGYPVEGLTGRITDGDFTQLSIISFQRQTGLVDDGQITNQLLTALAATTLILTDIDSQHLGAGAARFRRTALSPGEISAAPTAYKISVLQRLLSRHGFEPGAVTGQLTVFTSHAIRTFQKRTGLPQDGEYSDALLRQVFDFDLRTRGGAGGVFDGPPFGRFDRARDRGFGSPSCPSQFGCRVPDRSQYQPRQAQRSGRAPTFVQIPYCGAQVDCPSQLPASDGGLPRTTLISR